MSGGALCCAGPHHKSGEDSCRGKLFLLIDFRRGRLQLLYPVHAVGSDRMLDLFFSACARLQMLALVDKKDSLSADSLDILNIFGSSGNSAAACDALADTEYRQPYGQLCVSVGVSLTAQQHPGPHV